MARKDRREQFPFLNREQSWLAFNRRVLAEAENPENPLLEQANFLGIVGSNLDEFFMVRVAKLKNRIAAGLKARDAAGLSIEKQFALAREGAYAQMNAQYDAYDALCGRLAAAGILLDFELDEVARQRLSDIFREEIAPLLTPLQVDAYHRFPLLVGKWMQMGVLLKGATGKATSFAVLQLPPALPRLIALPAESGARRFIGVEDVIRLFAGELFGKRKLLDCAPFRITRNADLEFRTDVPPLRAVTEALKRRKWGPPVRLEIDARMSDMMRAVLQQALSVDDADVYAADGPIDLAGRMKALCGQEGFDALKFPPFTPRPCAALSTGDIFAAIAARDTFLYHPYDSFAPVVRFVSEAADDPLVTSIKMTLYRVSGQSPIVASLVRAAKAGKEVTVLVEIKARFDEENNLRWGAMMENAGCRVLYGIPGIKTHSKITLVTRVEDGGVARYLHLGTGNYHDGTARVYTDASLFTIDPQMGEDGESFFLRLAGYGKTPPMRALVSAPDHLRATLEELIAREADHAKAGRPARIDAKMNSLTDPGIIRALYDASRAGVDIRLVVRGVCCLVPGVPDVSETIEVTSIVGRQLEHARMFRFENDGDPEMYCASADWMRRNLDRRVELMFPIHDPGVRQEIEDILSLQERDTEKAWRLLPDGTYERVPREASEAPISAQDVLLAGEGGGMDGALLEE